MFDRQMFLWRKAADDSNMFRSSSDDFILLESKGTVGGGGLKQENY